MAMVGNTGSYCFVYFLVMVLIFMAGDIHDKIVTLIMSVRIYGVRQSVNMRINRMVIHGDGVGTTIFRDAIRDGIFAIMFRWVSTLVFGFVHCVMWDSVFDIMSRCVGTSVIGFAGCVVMCEVIMNLDIF